MRGGSRRSAPAPGAGRRAGVSPTKKGVSASQPGDVRSVYDVAVLQKALDVLEVLAERADLGHGFLGIDGAPAIGSWDDPIVR